jgi:hypothetical protein
METEEARRATTTWLSRREIPPPFDLELRVRRAVERVPVPGPSIPDTLVAAAVQCLRDAVRSGHERSAANELLTADALLTYAFEAAAEKGIEHLELLTRALDVARFEQLMRAALT